MCVYMYTYLTFLFGNLCSLEMSKQKKKLFSRSENGVYPSNLWCVSTITCL